MSMSKKLAQQLGEWLVQHPEVKRGGESAGNSGVRNRIYSYGSLKVAYTTNDKVILQGAGVGTVFFQSLRCETCAKQPRLIQALNYMVRQVNKRLANKHQSHGVARTIAKRRREERG